MKSQRVLTLASLYQLGTLLVVTVACVWLWSQAVAAIAAGGLLMALNFWLLRVLSSRALGGAKPSVAYALALGLKLLGVLGIAAVLILVLRLDVLGLAIGMATLFVGIGLATLQMHVAEPRVSPGSGG